MAIFKFHFYLIITALLFGLTSSGRCWADTNEPSVLIDTKAFSLTVLSADNLPLVQYHNIALGSGGVSANRIAGDATTPLGTFHISWVNPNSRFTIFFGLDFPSQIDAARALAQGTINQADYEAILTAHRDGSLPPQNTALGGGIGIHGIGDGDPEIHKHANWTKGCVALSNADALALSKWIRIGTKVVIR